MIVALRDFYLKFVMMSKLGKTIEKLKNQKKVFTFTELEYLLKKLDYIEKKTGKTSGSRVAFVNTKTKHIIRLHKPHPGNELKRYAKSYVIKELSIQGLI